MKKAIKYSLTAIITMLMCLIIAPSVFAEDTVYTTSDVTGGVRIDSVTTTETKLVIPEEIDGKAVVAIALNALKNTAVEDISIPATVTEMNGWTGVEWYSSLYSMEYLTKVTFAEGMRVLPKNALFGCTKVKEVVLPESLTVVSDIAFNNCVSLTSINIPTSITSIGDAAFYSCSSLNNIELPLSLTTIGASAFSGCTKFTEIMLPETVKTIGINAFGGTKISEIIIPATVTEMNGWTGVEWYSSLYSMEYLTKVTFAEGMRTLPKNTLFGCSEVKEVILPESLTVVSDNAFNNCVSLTSINIPASITSIGDAAFYSCSSLNNIELPLSLTTIGASAFSGCTKFTEIMLPETVKTIGINAFGGTKISEIIIPATVTEMNGWTGVEWYSSLYSMEYLTKVTFADGMKTVPENALLGCNYLEEVVIYNCNTSLDTMKIAAEENDYKLTVLTCESCKKYIIGDVNGDGRITAADARIVLRISAQLEKVENYNIPFEVFDIIRDEKITASDARKILRISAQLE